MTKESRKVCRLDYRIKGDLETRKGCGKPKLNFFFIVKNTQSIY